MSKQLSNNSPISFCDSLHGDVPAEAPVNTRSAPPDSGYTVLERSGFLRGVSFNGPNGPYKCSRQVCRVPPNAVYSVQACKDISNEELYPANEIDAAYVHMGWPVPSALPARPWEVMNPVPKATSGQSNWISRRMVVHKWTVSLRKEDLAPVEDFAKAVYETFKEPSVVDQIEALRGVFAAWGEMVPIAAVIGCSLAATGTLGSKQTLTGDSATFRPSDRGPDQGGYPELFSASGFNAWLTSAVNTDNAVTWEVQRICRLFSPSNMILRSPAVGSQISFGFDGAALGVKDIKQINVWQNGAVVQDISIVYIDGSVTGPYGFGLTPTNRMSDSFVLGRGEFITDVFVWAIPSGINAMQFAKNTCQLSPRYGIQNGAGDPSISNAGGNALLGLSGSCNTTSVLQIQKRPVPGPLTLLLLQQQARPQSVVEYMELKKNTSQHDPQNLLKGANIYEIAKGRSLSFTRSLTLQKQGDFTFRQAVWRGDVKSDECRTIATASIGSASAPIFNDYRFLCDPPTSYISQIRFRNTAQVVAGFQVTYSSKRDGTVVSQDTPIRGTDAGARDTWTLGEGEFINQVRGKATATAVYQLEFVTNKGNTKKIGQDAGDAFTVAPPNKDMVLYYLLGKSAGYMQTMTFVWGAPPV
ncbi:hypothetical protein RSOLAG22IIIB_07655 [Rhizoctonia solani]|uniref:Jacalin-type lectin domain-containing protein n=1 Tax=Rhizoctonia solani TaxID=456999 RepID=A0A0K6FPF8_9AGAM|nr:hypothetical protein RSOLAG22IIIB_07655 [Rhizoctonia solani]